MSKTLMEIVKEYSKGNNPSVTLPVVEEESFRDIFLKELPLIDVRAEIEFAKGAFKMAVNLPILNTDQRDLVGKSYKNFGQTDAIKVGSELIDGQSLLNKVSRWKEFIEKNSNAVLYCFRGGLRSKLAQAIIYEYTGLTIPRVAGGQKSLRAFLMTELSNIADENKFVIIGGKTGSGKTYFMHKLIKENIYKGVVDLEGLANHRGSAFGLICGEQPTQINFENNLTQELMRVSNNLDQVDQQFSSQIMLENESRSIGKLQIPDVLFKKMQSSPILIIEKSLEERANFILTTYIKEKYNNNINLFGNSGNSENSENCSERNHLLACESLLNDMLSSLSKIKSKMGGMRYEQCFKLFELAHKSLLNRYDFNSYLPPVEMLLKDYYDPFYEYNQECKNERIIFRGTEAELLSFAFPSK